MLRLPDVTLVLIETRQHELARLALEDCLRQVEFGGVLVFSNDPSSFSVPVIYVEDWREKIGWSQFYWSGVAPYLKTTHTLTIQWDSWVVNPACWREEFLEYDYVGAPWWYKDGRNVGNGGFSLRSAALCRFLCNNLDRFPCTTSLDDDLLCRKYRPALEEFNFRWAPENLAHHFSFECVKTDVESFGFHAMHNWGYVLDEARLLERAKIAQKSIYITKNSWMWAKLLHRNPKLAEQLDVPVPIE